MTNPPTLSEMKKALENPNASPTLAEMEHSLSSQAPSSPTLSQMELMSSEVFLIHYGIPGMKWGVRRSAAALGRLRGGKKHAVKDSDGDEVGELGVNGRSAAKKLKAMKAGEVVVVDTEKGPRVMVKQKDDSFRETTLSADAQAVLRTVNKQPSEMSTRELKEATARAQAIEQYNKIFNPMADPNAGLKARTEAMELQAKYATAYAKMNPSRTQRVSGFVKDMSPIFGIYKQVDNSLGGALTEQIKTEWAKARAAQTTGTRPPPAAKTKKPKTKSKKPKSNPDDTVYNVTNLGVVRDDPAYIPELGGKS